MRNWTPRRDVFSCYNATCNVTRWIVVPFFTYDPTTLRSNLKGENQNKITAELFLAPRTNYWCNDFSVNEDTEWSPRSADALALFKPTASVARWCSSTSILTNLWVMRCARASYFISWFVSLLLVYPSSSLGWRYGANSNPGSRHQPNWIRPGEKWKTFRTSRGCKLPTGSPTTNKAVCHWWVLKVASYDMLGEQLHYANQVKHGYDLCRRQNGFWMRIAIQLVFAGYIL